MVRSLLISLVAACPLLALVGCERPPSDKTSGPSSETHSVPVLREDDDAKTILDKALKAHGGENAFSRWSCGTVKYKTKGSIVPDQLGEVVVEDTFQLPGHFK